MKKSSWYTYGAALSTTVAVAFILCSIFDLAFRPYGLLQLIGSASPWPITGSLIGFITGLVMFSFMGFILGAIYAVAFGFWDKD